MSFARYPSYNDSGVEWLGAVPAHWRVGSARWLTRRYSGGTPDKTNVSYWRDGTIPWLSSGAVNDRLITEPSTHITEAAFASSSAKWIPKGALVMALAGQGKTKGMVAQLAIDSTCNQSMAAIIPGAEIDARFLFWWLESNYQNIRNMAGGDMRDGLNLELLGSIQCPLPPQVEQTQIAAFLDRETEKIDALVGEQRRLMGLLKEKRQAVISHAVTKGLDPHAQMKPSGIEWLGDVPAHWTSIQVGKICNKVADGPHFSPTYVDEGIPFLSARNVKVNEWALDDVKYISDSDCDEFDRRIIPCVGDVLYTKGGTTGIARVVDFEGRFQVWVHIAVLKTKPEVVDSYFLAFALNSVGCYEQSQLLTRGASNNDLGLTRMTKIWFALPPIEEQRAVVGTLKAKTAKLDILTAEAQRTIDLLQERRTALISAAVLGQIDVRDAMIS